MPASQVVASAAVFVSGAVHGTSLVVGSCDTNGNLEAWAFVPSTATITEVATSLSGGRSGTVLSWRGKILAIFGGSSTNNRGVLEASGGGWVQVCDLSDFYSTNGLRPQLVPLSDTKLLAIYPNAASAGTIAREIDYDPDTDSFSAGSTWPRPATWASTRYTVVACIDDVTDPSNPGVHVWYATSFTAAWNYAQFDGVNTPSAATLAYTPATLALPAGPLSEGRVEPRTDDVILADTPTLTPLDPPETGVMLLTFELAGGAVSDTFACTLLIASASGRVPATLRGTATGGTRVANQVTGCAAGTPVTVEWDCGADGIADGVAYLAAHDAPAILVVRE